MSLISEQVVPDNQGQIFGTDAQESEDLEKIKEKIMDLEGVKKVVIYDEVFPREFKIYTDRLVEVKIIEDAVIPLGFHVVPKDFLEEKL